MMVLLADENIDKEIVDGLRLDGYEILYIAEMEPGITDDKVLKLANDTNALLLTFDKNFGELVFRRKLINNGVILILLSGLSQLNKVDVVKRTLKQHSKKMNKSFTVITSGSIRIRP